MARHTIVQIWHKENDNNPEAWKKLVDMAESTKPIGKNIKKEYGFSWNSIRNDCVDRGIYKPKKFCNGKSEMEIKNITTSSCTDIKSKDFFVRDLAANAVFRSRSIQLESNVYERLNKLEESKRQFSKKLIINQLLSDALECYGF